MASMSVASIALLLSLNILFFNMVSSTYVPCPPPPPKKCHKCHSNNNNKPPAIKAACPRDALKLGVCANVLKNLLNVQLGIPPKLPCCSLLDGLVDLEAAACLCTALKANILGINLDVPISLSLLVNYCGKKVPYGFKCA